MAMPALLFGSRHQIDWSARPEELVQRWRWRYVIPCLFPHPCAATLQSHFGQWGRIAKVTVMRDPMTRASKYASLPRMVPIERGTPRRHLSICHDGLALSFSGSVAMISDWTLASGMQCDARPPGAWFAQGLWFRRIRGPGFDRPVHWSEARD
jgi:hypothetical protein